MLTEIYTWLTTPTSSTARRMGYLYEAIAMQRRAQRCQQDWAMHTQSSQQFIAQCVTSCQSRRKVLVFGSGLGLDVPIAALAQQFQQVLLVDMVHLRWVRKRWSAYANIHFIEADVSERLDKLIKGQLSWQQPEKWLDDAEIDFVISANLMSQLPLMPLAYADKKRPRLSEVALESWADDLIVSHLGYLHAFRQQGKSVCLIADTQWRFISPQSHIEEVYDPWRGATLPMAAQQQWQWQIIPEGEKANKQQQINEVAAWCW